MRRVDGEDLADDEPIEQHADRGEVLLDGRPRRRAFTFDSSRTPKRSVRPATPGTLTAVDLTAIVAALAASEHAGEPKTGPRGSTKDRERQLQLERELAAATARRA